MDFTFVDNSEELKRKVEENAERALMAVGLQCEGYAKLELERSPRRVDTGLLRNSITYAISNKPPQVTSYHGSNPSKRSGVKAVPIGFYSGNAPNDGDNLAVYVGTNVEYALYVHDGTSRMAANRFIKNALYNHVSTYQKILIEYLNM